MLDATHLPLSLQTLSPKAARFCLGLERFLLHELWPKDDNIQDAKPLQGKTFYVGLSGGADSVALLLALFYLQKRLGIEVQAVHVHHGLRSEADAEALAVARFCKDLGINCAVHHAPVREYADGEKLGLEEAGRRARYALFDSLTGENPDAWIALGHHADDLCEDILMRLIRGAGWPALGGMTGFGAKRHLVRPLLGTSRAEIERFLKGLGLTWVNDASNASLDYRRNRIRHNVVPLLREENPALHETMLSLWKLARIDADFWHDHLYTTAENALPSHTLDRNTLRRLPQAERLRLYKMMLDDLGTGQANVTTLLALDDAWQSGRGGVAFQFSGNKIATINRGAISFALLQTDK